MASEITWKKVVLAVVIAELLVLGAIGAAFVLSGTSGNEPHTHIWITGDADFTKANGVESGSGTADDPYVIEGWSIDWSMSTIRVINTTSHFVIRDCDLRMPDARGGWSADWLEYGLYSAGIGLDNVSNCMISNCAMESACCGIALEDCENITIMNNTIKEVGEHTGMVSIVVANSTSVTITGNDLGSGGLYVHCTDAEGFFSISISDDNTVNSRPVLFRKDEPSVTLSNVFAGQIIVANCSNAHLEDVSVEGGSYGIMMAFVSNATIADCTVSGSSQDGLRLYRCENIAVTHTELVQNRNYGLSARDCTGVSIVDSTIWMNSEYGIAFRESSDSSVARCLLTGNHIGLHILFCANLTIDENEFSGSSYSAVILADTTGVAVVNNSFTSTRTAIVLGDGTVDSMFFGNLIAANDLGISLRLNVSGTRVVANNFIENDVSVELLGSNLTNFLNGSYSEGGNFWSNCTGNDTLSGADQSLPGSDGIADTPFEATGNFTDQYPSMTPFGDHGGRPVAAIGVEEPYLSPSRGLQVNADESWDFNDSSNLTYQWMLESWSSEYSTSSYEYISSWNPGPHMLYLRVMDKEGNVGETGIGVLNDNEAPSLALWMQSSDDPDWIWGTDDSRTITEIGYDCHDLGAGFEYSSWDVIDDIESIQVFVDDVPLADTGLSYSSTRVWSVSDQHGYYSFPDLPHGIHTFRVTAVDALGNHNESEISVYIGQKPSLLNFAEIALVAGITVVAVGYLWDRHRRRPSPVAPGPAEASMPGAFGPRIDKDAGSRNDSEGADKSVDTRDRHSQPPN